MAIEVNIRHLERGSVELEGEVPFEELELPQVDESITCNSPLKYSLLVDTAGESLIARGRLEWLFECECVRCLKRFPFNVELPDWICHLEMEGEEAVAVKCDVVDLTPYAREDTLLDLPQHPLCSDDCNGGQMAPEKVEEVEEEKSSPWGVLDNLNLDKE